MTARMTVAERVARLLDLTPGQMLDLLIRLDAKSPRAMDDAIEYMLAATVVRAEIAGEDEAPAAPAPAAPEADHIPYCGAEDRDYTCTEAPGHDGDHRMGTPWHRWPQAGAVPPRAADDQELCNQLAPEFFSSPLRCNAAAGHGGLQHAAWGAGGLLVDTWPVVPGLERRGSRPLPFRLPSPGVLAEGEAAAAAGNVTELGALRLAAVMCRATCPAAPAWYCMLAPGHDGDHVSADETGFIGRTWTVSAESIADAQRVADEYPDGVHTCAELQALEPGRRACTCGRCPEPAGGTEAGAR